jgi:antitoxin VapB
MALNIKNGTAEQLAKELAALTGESLTQAVISALRDRLSAVRRRGARPDLRAEIAGLQAFLRKQPDRDRRGADEILGYDEHGLPN